jgi:pimeloyl-ACP methyl ester carboxylesterase
MPYVSVNGIDLHYREAGEGFPVVLVHGFTGNSRNWALTVPAVSASFRTISPDLRGHGLSSKPTRREDYTLEALAADVLALLRHLGISECYLAGHSMGGMVAQHLVLSQPHLFRALVLVDTAADPLPGMMTPERQRLIEIARRGDMEAVFEEQLRLNLLPPEIVSRPEILQIRREQFRLVAPEAYIYLSQAMAERRPLLDELANIQIPTLIVCGEKDEPFLAPSQAMHQRIEGSQLAIISGSGHTPQIERPEDFNDVLCRFLASVHAAISVKENR